MELLAGIPQLEQEALEAIWKAPLSPMVWSEFGEVYLDGARRNVADFPFVVAGLSAGELGAAAADIEPLASEVRRRLPAVPPENAAEIAAMALVDGLVVALAGTGWEVTSDIGEPLRCRHGERELEPLDEVMGLAEGTRSAAAWVARASQLGIAGLSLDPRG